MQIYEINSSGQSTTGGCPTWCLGEVVIRISRNNLICYKTFDKV